MSPVNGTVMRGCVLKPSSVLITSMSAQSETCTTQFGFGKLTRRNVFWAQSTCVKVSLGNGVVAGLDGSIRTLTPAPNASSGAASAAATAVVKVFIESLLVVVAARVCARRPLV